MYPYHVSVYMYNTSICIYGHIFHIRVRVYICMYARARARARVCMFAACAKVLMSIKYTITLYMYINMRNRGYSRICRKGSLCLGREKGR